MPLNLDAVLVQNELWAPQDLTPIDECQDKTQIFTQDLKGKRNIKKLDHRESFEFINKRNKSAVSIIAYNPIDSQE